MIRLLAADVRQFQDHAEALMPRVGAERRARMDGMRSERDRMRCLGAALLLDAVFKRRADEIVRDAFGKPRLPGGACFNLSHAGDYTVLAVSELEIGVDVERWRKADTAALSRRFFHPDEQAHLQRAADPVERFFTLWSLKESYMKAVGRGFSIAPGSFCVLPDQRDGARLTDGGAYHFKRYADFPGYALSVCALEDEFPDGVTVLTY